MTRLWINAAVLAVLLALCFGNNLYLKDLSEDLAAQLNEAESCVTDGDHEGAIEYIETALQLWTDHEVYLHIVLHHDDIDEILLSFQEVRQLVKNREDGGEYSAANAQLICRIRLIHEMEQFNMKNLL